MLSFLIELLLLFVLEKSFLTCFSLLFMIFELNFTGMFNIKNYLYHDFAALPLI